MIFNLDAPLKNLEYELLAPLLIEEIEQNSHFFSVKQRKALPKYQKSDFKLDEIIGEGGFCYIYSVTKKESLVENTRQSNKNKSTKTCDDSFPLALKIVKDNSTSSKNIRSLIDLSCEAKFLSTFTHKNIIVINGISEDILGGFFVMERLQITLEKKIKDWRNNRTKNQRRSSLTFSRSSSSSKFSNDLLERLSITKDLCSAFYYLHQNRLIHRDIKPDNIGFDFSGRVKVFDFGFCKELRAKHLDSQSYSSSKLYKLTEYVGTVPFMSPEVYFGSSYNELADVYSFGILLHEIVLLKSTETWIRSVGEKRLYEKGLPPQVCFQGLSHDLKNVIIKSVSRNMNLRPTLSQIYKLLENEVNLLRNKKLNL